MIATHSYHVIAVHMQFLLLYSPCLWLEKGPLDNVSFIKYVCVLNSLPELLYWDGNLRNVFLCILNVEGMEWENVLFSL